ncbi:MAG: DUF177 domain-containing protein [Deltaproteobacteria bacterium]|nr:DUF177 domain-containing protein [Deltaproteobacteria bacterium]
MKIRILDIPEEGLDLVEESPSKGVSPKGQDHWFDETVREALREKFPKTNRASFNAHLDKTCRNVSVVGQIEIDTDPTCDRCLEPFHHHLSIPLKMDMAPYEKPEEAAGDDIKLSKDDLNFSFYQGDEIDIAQIVHEQIVLETPIRNLCQEDCKGLCPQCGQNLNKGKCSCPPQKKHSPFVALKRIFKS